MSPRRAAAVFCWTVSWARNAFTSGTSRSTTSRLSASLITSAGSSRTTLSAVTLKTRPASRPIFTSSPQGRSSSMPSMRPMPRMSETPATPPSDAFKPLIMAAPHFAAFSSRPSSLTVDRLTEPRPHVLVVRRDLAHRIQVVQRHAHEALYQRLEARLDLAAAARRKRGERAPVEGFLHDDDGGLGDAAVMPVLARDL